MIALKKKSVNSLSHLLFLYFLILRYEAKDSKEIMKTEKYKFLRDFFLTDLSGKYFYFHEHWRDDAHFNHYTRLKIINELLAHSPFL